MAAASPGRKTAPRQNCLGLSRVCEDWTEEERQEVGRLWELAKAGFGLDKLLFSWLA